MARFEEALQAPELRAEAAKALRALIEEIRLAPDAEGTLRVELNGELAAILALGEGEKADGPIANRRGVTPRRFSLVAGACNHRQHTVCVEV